MGPEPSQYEPTNNGDHTNHFGSILMSLSWIRSKNQVLVEVQVKVLDLLQRWGFWIWCWTRSWTWSWTRSWTMLGTGTAGWRSGLPQAGVSGEPPDECARQGHRWKPRLPEQSGEDLDPRQQSIRTSRSDSDSTQKQPDEKR